MLVEIVKNYKRFLHSFHLVSFLEARFIFARGFGLFVVSFRCVICHDEEKNDLAVLAVVFI